MPNTIVLLDKIIYPLTLGLTIIIAFILFAFTTKLKKTNVHFEKTIGSYALFHSVITIFGFYVLFGRGENVLVTDLSPFVLLLVVIPLISQKMPWMRKALMPYLILSGIITMSVSTPGFASDFQHDPKYLAMFIEAFFTYIKHLVILICGIYLLFTNTQYQQWEWGLGLALPVVFISWIIIASGSFFWGTNNPRYGQASTGIFITSVIPWGGENKYLEHNFKAAHGINNAQYYYIIEHYGWQHLFVRHGDKWYAKYLTSKSLWGKSYYTGDATYYIVEFFAEKLRLNYYWITIIFYLICINIAHLIMLASQRGKHKVAKKQPN